MAFLYRDKCKEFVLLFITRILRMFSYGMLALVFFDNLFFKGLSADQASWIQSGIVFGDIIISLILTTQADRYGRINTLMIGALLKLITGLCYAKSDSIIILTISGILGVISVTGGQIGPFMPIQQSALSQLAEQCTEQQSQISENVAKVFGYYNMAGYLAQATGALFAGFFISLSIDNFGYSKQEAITNIVLLYALLGGAMFIGYCLMDRQQVEAHEVTQKKIVNCTGIRRQNLGTIMTLSALFSVDAFAGAFIVQSYLSQYYQAKYDLNFDNIGLALFVCNIVSGISGVLSSKLVNKFGAMATMIYTHLPSNVFLVLIGFTTTPFVSILLLFARFCISQMDVPARQTYVSMMVSSSQRSAANGITNIARSVGVCIGLGLNGYFMNLDRNSFEYSLPFIIGGGLKIFYDITIGCCFLWNKKSKSENQQSSQVQSQELVETPSMNLQELQEKQSK